MKKRYILMPLIILGLILFISPSIFKVSAISNDSDFSVNYSWTAWGLPNSSIYTPNNTNSYPLLSILGDYNYDLLKVQSQGLSPADNQDPYYLIIDTFMLSDSILINPWDGYLFLFFDVVNSRVFVYQAQYTNGNYLQISNDTYITDFSISYELSHDNPTTLRCSMLYKGAVRLANNDVFNMQNINTNWLSGWTINPYEGGLYDDIYNRFYADVYSDAYDTGYADGQAGDNAVTPFFNIMVSLFAGIDTILSIEIVPNIRLWYFIAIPLFFLIIWAVLRIWKHG